MSSEPIKLAGCLIQDQQGRILLLHRQKGNKDQWETPGGKIDPGETLEEAATRELKEELGVNVKLTRKVGEADFNEDSHTLHYTWFQAEIISGKPALQEPQTFTDLKYFTWDEIIGMYSQLSAGNKTLANLSQNQVISL